MDREVVMKVVSPNDENILLPFTHIACFGMLALLSHANIVLVLVFHHVLSESLGPSFGINGRDVILLNCLVAATYVGLFATLYLPVFLLSCRRTLVFRLMIAVVSTFLYFVLSTVCQVLLITDFAVL
jgi:hypothetical protein